MFLRWRFAVELGVLISCVFVLAKVRILMYETLRL
jgi:hypothetical protein